jgi:N-acetylmuramoyl-L-alanine amidase
MTRMTLPVSVLIECAYLICEKEAQLLSNKKFQKIIARAIAKGTVQYLKENF